MSFWAVPPYCAETGLTFWRLQGQLLGILGVQGLFHAGGCCGFTLKENSVYWNHQSLGSPSTTTMDPKQGKSHGFLQKVRATRWKILA